jgi:D-beta-D-heptose 7-phosphate kinase/D-beta-D-heptose 1-phosphate adenosyltransferase
MRYQQGILTPRVLRALVDAARSQRIPIRIDPRLDRDFSIYAGATAIAPNRYETDLATGMTLSDFEI